MNDRHHSSRAPAVSVVMAVYNAEETLRGTIESILVQSEADFELIVVDDGSTDSTSALLAGYATVDSRIRVIRQDNAGLTKALIAGCDAALGRYIARQDVGDLSHPTRLARQRALLDGADGLAFVSCATQFVGPELEPLWVTMPFGESTGPTFILNSPEWQQPLVAAPSCHGAVMFRRDSYRRAGGYRAEFYYGQDYDLWYRLAELGTFQGTREILYTARVMPGSLTSSSHHLQLRLGELSLAALRARQRGLTEVPILAAAFNIRPEPSGRNRSAYAAGLYFIGEALRRNGDRRARKYLWRAVRHWPLSAPAWVRLVQTLMS